MKDYSSNDSVKTDHPNAETVRNSVTAAQAYKAFIGTEPKFKNDEAKVKCPQCNKDNLSINRSGKFNCFTPSCAKGSGCIDMTMLASNANTVNQTCELLASEFNISPTTSLHTNQTLSISSKDNQPGTTRLSHHKRRAEDRFNKCEAVNLETPFGYCERKGIQPLSGRRAINRIALTKTQYIPKDALVLDYRDAVGELITLQYIRQDKPTGKTDKYFLLTKQLKDNREVLPVCWHSIGSLDKTPVIVIAEGYATGASIYMATEHPVAVVGGANNIKDVSLAVRATFPDSRIIVAADNGETGIKAAKSTGCDWTKPSKKSDFNDVHKAVNLKMVKDEFDNNITLSSQCLSPDPTTITTTDSTAAKSDGLKEPLAGKKNSSYRDQSDSQNSANVKVNCPIDQITISPSVVSVDSLEVDTARLSPTDGLPEERQSSVRSVSKMNRADAIQCLKDIVATAASHLTGKGTDKELAIESIYSDEVLGVIKTLDSIDPVIRVKFREKIKGTGIGLRPWDKALKNAALTAIQLSDKVKADIERVKQAKADHEELELKKEKAACELGNPYVRAGAFTYVTEKGGIRVEQESIIANQLNDSLEDYWAYQPESHTWYKYEGTHWQASTDNRLESDLISLLSIGCKPSGYSSRTLAGVYNLIESSGKLRLPPENKAIIPFKNGLLNIELMTGALATPRTAPTYCLPHKYTTSSDCPEFIKWLNQATGEDEETITFLRAWIAAIITGRSDLQVFLHLVGYAGTGKGTFFRLCSEIVGKLNTFTTDFKRLDTNRFEVAGVVGKRLVMIPDADGYAGSVQTFKSLTGEDDLSIERKQIQRGSGYTYDGMVMVASNTYIASTDNTSGIERRRKTIRFDRVATNEEKATMSKRGGLDSLLQSEIPQIINWALKLSRDEVTRIIRAETKAMNKANAEAARINNPVRAWVDECCKFNVNAWSQTGNKASGNHCLFPNYLNWCDQYGLMSLSCPKFVQVLEDVAQTIGEQIE